MARENYAEQNLNNVIILLDHRVHIFSHIQTPPQNSARSNAARHDGVRQMQFAHLMILEWILFMI